MKVYLLWESDQEGEKLLGVYAAREAAEAKMVELERLNPEPRGCWGWYVSEEEVLS